ncbi:hypothetical protein PYW07_011738 [Mythimna separata]|uniref:Uncharacterized protein n=1 Tax=Mythimna separata TaxID=271217 RepID=A0AAD7Y6T1_MYTSE|nr:hypothetical protein PYW07_011735 [Mythimna separata]KAJ8704549.1 hypothetical protein PYW07_011737 [Mythimna separata]KAJ8704550.1 hypothetical protein PYW07_011738 [Mythimna separata]
MVSEQVECGEFRLGTTPVAVKLYSNCSTWQREACVYALPHVAHPNILRYYDIMVSEQVECGEFRLGTTPVAVKLYSNCSTWQREACVYALPHVAHPNILRYYGE